MEWPFVRRSKYESILNDLNNLLSKDYDGASLNTLLFDFAKAHDDRDRVYELLRVQYEQIEKLINDTNILNQELQETKDALKIVQEDLRQHQMALSAADMRADKAKSDISKIRGYLRKIAKDL